MLLPNPRLNDKRNRSRNEWKMKDPDNTSITVAEKNNINKQNAECRLITHGFAAVLFLPEDNFGTPKCALLPPCYGLNAGWICALWETFEHVNIWEYPGRQGLQELDGKANIDWLTYVFMETNTKISRSTTMPICQKSFERFVTFLLLLLCFVFCSFFVVVLLIFLYTLGRWKIKYIPWCGFLGWHEFENLCGYDTEDIM